MKVIIVFVSVLAATFSLSSDVGLDSVTVISVSFVPFDLILSCKIKLELIKKYGYPSESHYVITEDGYILHLHRIPHGRGKVCTKNDRPDVVLIMHGLVATSADFLSIGPNRSLAFILADVGYDVWLINSRGNAWSRNHTTLHPEFQKKQFWNFSWHEMGIYDLADSMDYVLHKTGHSSLFFIGHSQGTTAFFVLTSSRPEYNSKIKLATLMAPSAGTPHIISNMFFRMLARYSDRIQAVLEMFEIYECPYLDFIRHWGVIICGDSAIPSICIMLLDMLKLLPDWSQFDPATLPVMLTNLPSGASIKQFIHYLQLIPEGGLYHFDYGPAENLRIYGSRMPPPYNMSKISAPVAVYYGNDDQITNRQDSESTCDKLPNLVVRYLVPHELFNHIDFTFGMKVKTLVFDKILNVMETYKDNNV